MIQKVNPHNSGTPPGPEIWGSWGPPSPYGRKYYSLEVVQNPIRARMCGFGDKDRRPLAPAAVAKMHVQREDHSVVDVDEVDCSFFLVTVDLWSVDGNKEMNLVLHPTSSDRYVPNGAPNKKRRNTAASAAATTSTQAGSQPTESQSPVPPTPSTSQYPPTTGMTPYMTPTTPGYQHAYPFPPQPNTVADAAGSFTPVTPYGAPPPTDPSSWAYSTSPTLDRPSQPFGPPALPSIQTLARTESQTSATNAEVSFEATSPTHAAESWHVAGGSRDETDPYRAWPPEQHGYSALEGNPPSAIDPSLREPSVQTPASQSQPWSTSPIDPYANARYHVVPVPGPVPSQGSPSQPAQPPPLPPAQPVDTGMYASASYAQQQHQQQQHQAQAQAAFPHAPNYTQNPNPTPPSTIPPLPRHTYTRTLVGPLSANACRLLDEHRKPGIFFLFQDLSIRTEGTFRLRLRLMNVGAPPAPEPGGYRVHTDVSPVLAQTFTDPFIVYSAKRFPGVPDTTALSIALGNQGQKLPLRNRNNTKSRKRTRNGHGSDESGEESDD
ncbi:velvet complex subunit B [Phanerochaete sordida]|uniref:Velvet complex subunit B n=1 Tax=Phanerochaete sordida TaxID=48140 RepID=A0A9P3FXX1_9APHY|nr:velvet complex subunit B [Phanerochaete sordida]